MQQHMRANTAASLDVYHLNSIFPYVPTSPNSHAGALAWQVGPDTTAASYFGRVSKERIGRTVREGVSEQQAEHRSREGNPRWPKLQPLWRGKVASGVVRCCMSPVVVRPQQTGGPRKRPFFCLRNDRFMPRHPFLMRLFFIVPSPAFAFSMPREQT